MSNDVTGIVAVSVLFGGPMLVWLMSVMSDAVVKITCHWRDVSLKIKLVQAGVPAREIERIVLAGRSGVLSDEESPEIAAPAKKSKTATPEVRNDTELVWDK